MVLSIRSVTLLICILCLVLVLVWRPRSGVLEAAESKANTGTELPDTAAKGVTSHPPRLSELGIFAQQLKSLEEGAQPVASSVEFSAFSSNHVEVVRLCHSNRKNRSNGVTDLPSCPPERVVEYVPNYADFVVTVFCALNQVLVDARPLHWLVANDVFFSPDVPQNGLYLEFGLFKGASLRRWSDAVFKRYPNASDVTGFDSFKGLPQKWGGVAAGAFHGPYETVRKAIDPRVNLQKGWFQNSLPQYLALRPSVPLSFLHLDGDLFVSAIIPLQLLIPHVRRGTLVLFDELVYHRKGYYTDELLALYLWVRSTNARLCAQAKYGGLDEEDLLHGVAPARKKAPARESAAFSVLSVGLGT